jgi:Mce-associated membrane protein
VTEPALGAGPAGTSWRVANIVLVVLVLLLVATSVLLFTKGAEATPGESKAETLSREYSQVTKAATDETLAFLTVDYKNMDPLIAKVLAGSTGSFKQQYSQAQVNLKSSAQQSRAVSTGKVLAVGVGNIDDSNAVVFIAADSQVTNESTKGKPQPRYYRLRVSMTRKGSAWLTSNLQFVG